MQQVLITDGVHPLLIDGLEQMGFRCVYEPQISLEAVRQRVKDYVGMIINSKIRVDRAMLDAAVQMRFIGRLGSGLEIIDLAYAAERGVAVHSAPEGNRNAVAEHAMGMLLALANNLLAADRGVRDRIWRREAMRGWELWGKTVGIIGFGNTGRSFASKLESFGVRILAYDKYHPFFSDQFSSVRNSDLAEIQAEADIISLHLPLTAEVHHLVDASFLEACREGVIIINTSRGQVVRTSDLLAALSSGRVGGACLDVFENEKVATFSEAESRTYEALYRRPDVILSPHVAGWTRESKQRLAEVLLRKIRATEYSRNPAQEVD